MVDWLGLAVPSAPNARTDRDPDPLKGGDVYKWALEQAAHIREGRFDKIDRVNVADEIESVGKSEFRSLASNLEIILAHMLKRDFQQERRSRSWINSIHEHRERASIDLAENPSLTARRDDAMRQGYRLARYRAAKETKLTLDKFPDVRPYNWDDVTIRPFVLDQTDKDT